jgi:hypothetical protein
MRDHELRSLDRQTGLEAKPEDDSYVRCSTCEYLSGQGLGTRPRILTPEQVQMLRKGLAEAN